MDTVKNYKWYKVAESMAEITQRGQRQSMVVNLFGTEICLSVHNEQIFGCNNKCPHAGAKFSDGWIDALGNIVCPLHRYKFNVKNGYNSSGEGYHLKTYPVKETDDGVFVGII